MWPFSKKPPLASPGSHDPVGRDVQVGDVMGYVGGPEVTASFVRDGFEPPYPDRVYTVKSVHWGPIVGNDAGSTAVGFCFKELKERPGRAYRARCFRSLHRPRADAFSDLLKVPADLAAESGGAPLSVPALSEAPGGKP